MPLSSYNSTSKDKNRPINSNYATPPESKAKESPRHAQSNAIRPQAAVPSRPPTASNGKEHSSEKPRIPNRSQHRHHSNEPTTEIKQTSHNNDLQRLEKANDKLAGEHWRDFDWPGHQSDTKSMLRAHWNCLPRDIEKPNKFSNEAKDFADFIDYIREDAARKRGGAKSRFAVLVLQLGQGPGKPIRYRAMLAEWTLESARTLLMKSADYEVALHALVSLHETSKAAITAVSTGKDEWTRLSDGTILSDGYVHRTYWEAPGKHGDFIGGQKRSNSPAPGESLAQLRSGTPYLSTPIRSSSIQSNSDVPSNPSSSQSKHLAPGKSSGPKKTRTTDSEPSWTNTSSASPKVSRQSSLDEASSAHTPDTPIFQIPMRPTKTDNDAKEALEIIRLAPEFLSAHPEMKELVAYVDRNHRDGQTLRDYHNNSFRLDNRGLVGLSDPHFEYEGIGPDAAVFLNGLWSRSPNNEPRSNEAKDFKEYMKRIKANARARRGKQPREAFEVLVLLLKQGQPRAIYYLAMLVRTTVEGIGRYMLIEGREMSSVKEALKSLVRTSSAAKTARRKDNNEGCTILDEGRINFWFWSGEPDGPSIAE